MIEMVGDLDGDVVDIAVVVAVFRTSLGLFAQIIKTFPVGLKRLRQRLHVADLILENELFHSRQRIGHDRQADAGDDRADVVLRAAGKDPSRFPCSAQCRTKGMGAAPFPCADAVPRW